MLCFMMFYVLNRRFQLKASEIACICDDIKMYKASHTIPAWLVYSSVCHGLPHDCMFVFRTHCQTRNRPIPFPQSQKVDQSMKRWKKCDKLDSLGFDGLKLRTTPYIPESRVKYGKVKGPLKTMASLKRVWLEMHDVLIYIYIHREMVGNSTYIYIYIQYYIMDDWNLECLAVIHVYVCIYIYMCVHIMKAPASPNIGKNG